MCWNREVSILTGTTATALCGYLLVNGKGNDIPVALVSLAVALMQFAEAFLWEGVNQQDISKTTLGGRIGLLALFLQPLALSVGIAWVRGWSVPLVGVVWAILALPTLLPLLRREWTAQAGKCGHLQWSFLEPMLQSAFAPFYWVVMLGGWLLFQPLSEGVWYSTMAVTTLLVTTHFFPGEWGTLWCFIANALPLGRIL
jgi:hypothetical protein